MSENPYRLTPDPTPKELARAEMLRQVLEDLFEHHISVIGRQHYGKTVFVTALAAAARESGRFSDVVFWDLRHFTPGNDAEFFAKFAETLVEQLTSVGEDARSHFGTVENRTYSRIKGFFEYLQGLEKRVLIVMDGMDQPLDCEGLTKNLWDNLAGFAKIGSVNLLATSRKPLRQLCKSATGRASDFWERFEDPPIRLKAFIGEEITSFLKPLVEVRGGLEQGVEAEFANWTGGIPRLAVCVARRLFEGERSPVTVGNVRVAAGWVLSKHVDALEAAWDVCTAEEQTGFADLIEKREVEARDAGKLAHALVPLGLAQATGNKIRAHCELLKQFTSSLQSGLVSVKLLFGEKPVYERNIRAVVEWRLRQITVKNPDLKDFVADAVARVGNPKLFFKEVRNIVDHALTVIWNFECPDGQSPRYQSGFAASKAGPLTFNDTGSLLYHLLLSTDSRNRITLKKANRRIYSLLNELQGYGDLGQHQGNEVMPPAFAAAACLTVVELAAEMDKAGF
ncbi:MAG TPA: hypothetical protein PK640_00135 [Verrucomicrobiota bacterium]|nr:hypothetical protein [Verrucomicrobiota bacterium]